MSKAPNFLFLFPDQWRWDFLACAEEGIPVRTPNIDALAARGVRFTQCRSNSPVCSPARAALATGMRYHRCGVPNNSYDLDPGRANVFQLLRNAGYRVATCGKCDLYKSTPWCGLEGWTHRLGQYGFTDALDQFGKLDATNNGWPEPKDAYTAHLHRHGLMRLHHEDYERRNAEGGGPHALWPTPLERRHYTDDFTGDNALTLLDRMPMDEPWTLWVNFPGPHDPFDPPESLQRRYDGVTFPAPVCAEQADAQGRALDHQQIRRNYAACCEGIDEWVGWILDRVAQRGELERTVVIFGSDHGEMLGDHGRFYKAVPQEGSVRVPLIVAGPGIDASAVSDALIELIDIGATMLDLAGVEQPEHFDARSFSPILRGASQAHRDVQCAALKDWRMICDGRWKLIERDETAPTLFDLDNDPGETTDRASDEPKTVDALSRRLAEETAAAPA